MNFDFSVSIKDSMITFIKEYKYKIIGIICIIITLSILSSYFSTCHSFHNKENVENQAIKANYKSDMNFLECIAEQHSCIYKNLLKNIDPKSIIEGCGDENYCSNSNSSSNSNSK